MNSLTPSPDPDGIPPVRARSQALHGVREARRQTGQFPTAGRRVLLQSPIWFDAKVARAHITTSWVWDVQTGEGTSRRGISTINNEPLEGRPNPSGKGVSETGGLLRWVDLDLMLALSYHWQETGQARITIEQKTALSWIGYESMENPPFEELRASISRLQATQFRHFIEKPMGGYDTQIIAPLLMQPQTYRDGKRVWLSTTIGDGWLSEIQKENQTVDLRAYLNLVRAIRMADANARRKGPHTLVRPPDVSRSVLLFLDCFRRNDQRSSVIKLDWLQERFATRRVAIPKQNQQVSALLNNQRRGPDISLDGPSGLPDQARPTYHTADPLHEKSNIRACLEALCQMRILSGYEARGDRLEVRWSDPHQLAVPLISDSRPRQTRLIEVDRITGEAHLVDAPQLPPLEPEEAAEAASPDTRAEPGHGVVALRNQQSAAGEASAPALTPGGIFDPGTLGPDLQRVLNTLTTTYVGLNNRRLQALAKEGWKQSQLLALIITTIYHNQEAPLPGSQNKILIPRQFILKRLSEDSPSVWLKGGMTAGGFDPDAILRWFNRPGGFKEELLASE